MRPEVTLQNALDDLSARCDSKLRLVDRWEREIRIVNAAGCAGGAEPSRGQMGALSVEARKQDAMLKALRAECTVIVVPCNPFVP